MKNKTKIIGIIVAIIVILIGIVGIIIRSNLRKDNAEQTQSASSEEGVDAIIEQKVKNTKYEMTELKDVTKFFSVEKYIQKDTTLGFKAKEMYMAEEENMVIYVVHGNQIENVEEISQAYYVLRLDIENLAYMLTEIEEQEYENMKNGTFKIEVTKIEQIEENKFAYMEPMTERKICEIYLNKFTELELTNPKEAYKLLEEECKKERFPNYSEFEKYIVQLEQKMKEVELKKYETKEFDDYIQYTIQDDLDNVYQIKARGVMNYTVKID